MRKILRTECPVIDCSWSVVTVFSFAPSMMAITIGEIEKAIASNATPLLEHLAMCHLDAMTALYHSKSTGRHTFLGFRMN